MQPASNAIQSIATHSKQSNQLTQRQCEMQRNPANAIKSNFTTLPVTTIPVTRYLTQPNAVEEKYTTSKNSGAKFWVTHGRLRGLTFEHFQKLEVGGEKPSSDWRVEFAGVGSDEPLCTGPDST